MFYISGIDGSLSPYVEGLFRSLYQARVEAVGPVEQSSPSPSADRTQLDSVSSSGTVGLAAASLEYRSQRPNLATELIGDAAAGSHLEPSSGTASPLQPVSPSRKESDQDGEIAERSQSDRLSQTPYGKPEPSQKREPALIAEQIMSAPVQSILQSASLAEAREIFAKERFRHLPVVNERGRLVGILSDRSFLTFAHPRPLEDEKAEQRPKTVKEIMSTTILTARPTTEIREVARIMFKERIGAMPLLDDNGTLVGILTRSDILRAVVNRAPLELWV